MKRRIDYEIELQLDLKDMELRDHGIEGLRSDK